MVFLWNLKNSFIEMKIDLQPNELVVKAGDTQFLNGKKVDGKLIVTNQRIYFEAIHDDDKHYNIRIDPETIREVLPFNSYVILPDGLNIVRKNGDQFRFRVKKRGSWESMINRMY